MKKFIIIASILLLVACGNGAEATPDGSQSVDSGVAEPGNPNATATFSLDATAPPELLTPDAAARPTLFAYPPETLTTIQLHERLDPFASEVCQLPCYGGLIPGRSNVQDVLAFYSQLGIPAINLAPGNFQDVQTDRTGHMKATLLLTSDVMDSQSLGLEPPQVDVYVDNDVVQYFYVVWAYQPNYLTAQKIVNELGEPDRLEFDIGLFAGAEPVYVLTMTYAENVEGSFAYAVIGAFEVGDDHTLCFREGLIGSTYLSGFAPGQVPLEGLFGEGLVPAEEGFQLSKSEVTSLIGSGSCLTVPDAQFESLLNS